MIIRDAIHGGIDVNPLEEQILDHPLVQRLRHVRQLSLVHLVYPSALHTRFEHSLGSMHLSGKLAKSLGLSDEQVQLVRLAGLLHDVGHGAFSHSSDRLLIQKTGRTHEMRGMDLVEKTGLKDALQQNGVSMHELRECFEGKGGGTIITSELGCDRMDYLMRDAYFTGVSYSLLDHQRLLETMTLKEGQLVIQEKGAVAAESLLVSRHLMFNAVYLHPTVRICEAMVEKMLDTSLQDGQITMEGVAQGTDDAVLADLAEKRNPLANRLLRRELFKKAFVQPAGQNQTESAKKQMHCIITDALQDADLDEKQHVICLPPENKTHHGIHVLIKDGRVMPLEKISNLVSALNRPSSRDTLIVACEKGMEEKVAKAVQTALAD
ncbi:HD domain-containing protein [Candidatus Micrarchaeota archaeon]|nr:HD domain-containing protein [Candidatus Micrarchaeota archaeon]